MHTLRTRSRYPLVPNNSETFIVQWLKNGGLVPEDMAAEEVGKGLVDLVACKGTSRDGEGVVELLESELLGFGEEKEEQDECDNIETCRTGLVWVVLNRGRNWYVPA